MEIAYSILLSLALMALVYKVFNKENPDLPVWLLPGLLGVKILAGVGVFLIYQIYYGADRETADTFRFFDDAMVFIEAWKIHPKYYFQLMFDLEGDQTLAQLKDKMVNWSRPYDYGNYNDNRTLIRVNAIIGLFSFGFYHVHSVVMNFISFSGLYLLFKSFQHPDRRIKMGQLALLVLTPGILLWSSGVLKEGILFMAIGLTTYGLTRMVKKFSTQHLALLLIGLTLLTVTKSYILMMLVPGLLTYIITQKTKFNAWLIGAFVHLLMLIIALNLHHLGPKFDVQRTLVRKQRDFVAVAVDGDANSAFIPPKITRNGWSLIEKSPEALLNGLFRPFPQDANGAFQYMAVAENIVVMLLILTMTFLAFKQRAARPEMILGWSFLIMLSILIGLTTPVSGAIVRYKIPAIALVFATLTYALPYGRKELE